MTYLDRLAARVEAVGTSLCLGIDPHPNALPMGYQAGVAGIERFAALLVDSALEHVAAVKVNIAFFEAFGSAGLAAVERLRQRIPASVPLIIDAKRGDIGSTAERHAVALFDALGADAVTASPYLGGDALEPLLDRPEKFVYVLCRTSNPGVGEIQNLELNGTPLYLAVATRTAEWGRAHGNAGLVVGATAPAELARIRAAAPGLPFLIPGIGTQGGDLEAVLESGPVTTGAAAARPGGSMLVNVSRGIAQAALGATDPGAAISAAAAGWAARLPVLRSLS